MKILVKMPSRGRAEKLISTLSKAIAKADNNSKIVYQLTLDKNDSITNNAGFDKTIEKLRQHAEINVIRGTSTGKINACNRDMRLAPDDWEIVLLLSDDMICKTKGWDTIISQDMQEMYPDTDGLLFYNDGHTGDALNTLTIMGRKYFERFGYLYHPSYKSLWCDNELMDVGYILGKQKYDERVLFEHEHPANVGGIADELYAINDSYYTVDKRNYDKRKALNFDL